MSRLPDKKLVMLYILLLVGHMAHVIEEILGDFIAIEKFKSPEFFLAVNLLLFAIPVMLFCFFLQKKRWAYKLSIIYAGIMVLNGMAHITATLITGRYFHGYAGCFTGIWLIVIGVILIYYMIMSLKENRYQQQ
jgi:hypothetical protein